MIIRVLCWFSAGTGQAQGTRHSYMRIESQLGVGWSFGQEGFSLHDKWVLTRSKAEINAASKLA